LSSKIARKVSVDMRFAITITRDEDGIYIAECRAIPGCVSQGKTEADAEANIQDAIRQCLKVRAETGMSWAASGKH
jgi:predicted RNase H-like HicB family nuclease